MTSKNTPWSDAFVEAMQNGDLHAAEQLLKQGCPPDSWVSMDDWEGTLLHVSARNENLMEFSRLLLEWGADWRIPDSMGSVVGDIAVAQNNLALVEYLIREKGASFWERGEQTPSPLYRMFLNGTMEEVEKILTILEKETDVRNAPEAYQEIFCGAILRTEAPVAMLEWLEKRGYELPTLLLGEPSLLCATANREHGIALVTYLLGKGWDATVQTRHGWTLLGMASAYGNLPLVRYLMEERHVPLETPGSLCSVIASAAETDALELVKYLVETQGADVRQGHVADHWTALHNACREGYFEVAKYLIAQGADVNAVGGYANVTPVHSAASNQHRNILRMLIQHGGRVDIPNRNGATPLDLAKRKTAFVDVVEYLTNYEVMLGIRSFEEMLLFPMDDFTFSTAYGEFFLVKSATLANRLAGRMGFEKGTGWLLMYVFVDGEGRLSYLVLTQGQPQPEGGMAFLPRTNWDEPVICYPKELAQCLGSYVTDGIDTQRYEAYLQKVVGPFRQDEMLESLRRDGWLDTLRHKVYPDHLMVFLARSPQEYERAWVRVQEAIDSKFQGCLLTEPKQPLGIHVGDTIAFRVGRTLSKNDREHPEYDYFALAICEKD
ncbi:MAG: ankyrin repeat domain-containing protein [Planctomycetia bacterium]|nr:ankyrin repeat domain-containing protein [Planctomycetia bacterium]